MNKKKRTNAQRVVIAAAGSKDTTVDCLTSEARSSGMFIKPGTESKENYSQSWVLDRLRHNDMRVAQKLTNFAGTL